LHVHTAELLKKRQTVLYDIKEEIDRRVRLKKAIFKVKKVTEGIRERIDM
jgi:hypothetical protein